MKNVNNSEKMEVVGNIFSPEENLENEMLQLNLNQEHLKKLEKIVSQEFLNFITNQLESRGLDDLPASFTRISFLETNGKKGQKRKFEEISTSSASKKNRS